VGDLGSKQQQLSHTAEVLKFTFSKRLQEVTKGYSFFLGEYAFNCIKMGGGENILFQQSQNLTTLVNLVLNHQQIKVTPTFSCNYHSPLKKRLLLLHKLQIMTLHISNFLHAQNALIPCTN